MIFFLACLVALGWYCYHTFSTGSSPLGAVASRAMSAVVSGAAPKLPPAPAPAQPPASVGPPNPPPGPALGNPSDPSQAALAPVPAVSGTYVFQFREVPAATELQTGKGDCQIVVDKASGVVAAFGPKPSVDSVLMFCRAIDQIGGSCAVQTWAVYVDRSVQKGFDLVAAIRSVTALETNGTFGNGGFTLNLTAGDVTVALAAIADGSAVEVVQRSHVRLAHGVTSKIESTQEYPIPFSTVSNGVSQGSVQYRKVGLQLEVTPSFLSHDMVRLGVNQINGIIGDSVEIQGSRIPVIQSQTLQTTVDLTTGQTVVLGGVTTKRIKTIRGLLRNTEEVTEGALYIILSTYNDVPRALPVGVPEMRSPAGESVPMSVPLDAPADWIDNNLLPPADWKSEETKLVRSRLGK